MRRGTSTYKRTRNGLWTFKSSIPRLPLASASSLCSAHSTLDQIIAQAVDLLRVHGSQASPPSGLAIIRTCRQIYLEATSTLYGQYHHTNAQTSSPTLNESYVDQPTISFGILGRAPYFILNTFPQRLAQIRHIQLDYVETTLHQHGDHCGKSSSYALRCTDCNLCHWLEQIEEHMIGLRTIDVFMTFRSELPNLAGYPGYKYPWLIALFDLQRKRKVIRHFSINTDPRMRPGEAFEDVRTMKKFEKAVRYRLSELKQATTVSEQKLEV